MEEETDKDWSNKEQEEWLKIHFILLHYRLVPPNSLVLAFFMRGSLGTRLLGGTSL